MLIAFYKCLKFIFITVPVVALILSPCIVLLDCLPSPFGFWAMRIAASIALFSVVSVFVLYPLSERIDRRFYIR